MRIRPAVWSLRAYSDSSTQRAFRYFRNGEPASELEFKKPLIPRR